MTDSPSRTNVERDRVPIFLLPELVEWVNANMGPGGMFGSPGHAAERALGRLRLEHDTVRQLCQEKSVSFRPTVFWKLHAAFIEESTPGRWSRKPDAPPRVKVYATVAVELLEWITRAGIKAGPFETVGQAVEVGLRRMQATEFHAPEEAVPPLLSPFALWVQYERLTESKTKAP